MKTVAAIISIAAASSAFRTVAPAPSRATAGPTRSALASEAVADDAVDAAAATEIAPAAVAAGVDAPAAIASGTQTRTAARTDADRAALAELRALATASNPVLGYWDPVGLADSDLFGDGPAQNAAWLRQAEIKHGRVAMAAFVGYCVQSRFTWGDGFPSVDLGPEAQWDALAPELRWSIILLVGLSEWIDEGNKEMGHYLNGRDPGRHPLFQKKGKRNEERLARGRVAEINNGRLAMIGIMAFVSQSSVPGAVPLLGHITSLPAYTGNIWAPFEGGFGF